MLQVAYRDFTFRPEALQQLEAQGERGAHTKDLIQSLLVRDPAERMAFVRQIKRHPFFDGVDWDAVVIKEAAVPPPPPGALNISTPEDMAMLTTSIELDLDLIAEGQPTHSASRFDAIHTKPE